MMRLMDFEIRPCQEGEIRRALEICETAFGAGVSDGDAARMEALIEPQRSFMAFDGDAAVGTGGNFTFELTVPGAVSLPAAGLTMVGVLPSHRRKGMLTQLMRTFLADAKKRGEPLSVLWASEGSIYQRFGFGIATRQIIISAQADRMRMIDQPDPLVARMHTEQEAAEVIPPIYDRIRARTPGMYARSKKWWTAKTLADPEDHRNGGGPMWYATIEKDGRPEGYALYRIHGAWETFAAGKVAVQEAMATSPAVEKALWNYLFNIDLVKDIEAYFLPLDHPLQLMVTEPRRLRAKIVEALWLRIVDVTGALAGRAYLTDDTITFELTDGFLPENEGVWRLETSGGEGRAARSEGAPDVRLSAADLGGMYLGGCTFSELLSAGRGEEITPGAARRMDLMFASEITPWCPEIF